MAAVAEGRVPAMVTLAAEARAVTARGHRGGRGTKGAGDGDTDVGGKGGGGGSDVEYWRCGVAAIAGGSGERRVVAAMAAMATATMMAAVVAGVSCDGRDSDVL